MLCEIDRLNIEALSEAYKGFMIRLRTYGGEEYIGYKYCGFIPHEHNGEWLYFEYGEFNVK